MFVNITELLLLPFQTYFPQCYCFFRFSIAEANSSRGLMNTLTIARLTRDDGGDYNCIASNKHGSASLSVNFAVFGISCVCTMANL